MNVYLEPATQGRWITQTRGKLLELDRGDIGVTEIVRLALARLAEELDPYRLVMEYDRRFAEDHEQLGMPMNEAG